jgi:glyoxylate/hydroxypyruvate reductase A
MLKMKIAVCCTDTRVEPWLAGLRLALPDANIFLADPEASSFEHLEQADYAVVWAPPQGFINSQHSLKAIFNIGAGVDALMALRLPAGVPVVRLDDAGMAVQMAEYVCHAVIRHFRELDVYEAEAADGRWAHLKPRRRADFTVGIMGLGVLGVRVSQALAQFDFPVLGWSRSPRQLAGVQCFAGEAGLADFLAATQVLVCLLPLTPQTEGIMRRETLRQLKPGAYVINVARGGHLVDEDLLALIDSGHLAGATLDVFRTEPLPAGHPFWQHPKITITPHTSARTLRNESIAQIAGKLVALQNGQTLASLAGVVNPLQGY